MVRRQVDENSYIKATGSGDREWRSRLTTCQKNKNSKDTIMPSACHVHIFAPDIVPHTRQPSRLVSESVSPAPLTTYINNLLEQTYCPSEDQQVRKVLSLSHHQQFPKQLARSGPQPFFCPILSLPLATCTTPSPSHRPHTHAQPLPMALSHTRALFLYCSMCGMIASRAALCAEDECQCSSYH